MKGPVRGLRRWLSIIGPLVWLTLVGVYVAFVGFPDNAFAQVGWVALALLSLSIRDPRAAVRSVVLEWSPILFVLFLYDAIHDQLSAIIPASHTFPQIHVDRWLGDGRLPTLALQHAWYIPGHPRPWDYVALAVYTSHFYLSLLVVLLLWKRRSPRFRQFVWAFVSLTTVGYITYIAYPAVPPWLAAHRGALPPVHRIVQETLRHMGLGSIADQFTSSGGTLAVDVAAMPSLHAAYPALLTLFFWRAGWAARVPLVIYALAMALSLVYLGEHYVIDILVGWAYAGLTWAGFRRMGAGRPLSRESRAQVP